MSSKATQREAKRLGEFGDKLAYKHNAGPVQVTDTTLPAQYFSQADLERKYHAKHEYVKALAQNKENEGVTYTYQPTDAEIDHEYTKLNEIEHANFEKWLADSYDPTDPVKANILYEMYPGFFDKRMEEVERHLALQRKIAQLKNRGPTSADDLYLMWQLSRNKIPIPSKPAFVTTDSEAAKYDEVRQRGVLNYKRLIDPFKIKHNVQPYAAGWWINMGGAKQQQEEQA
jgi:hypothetical protein